MDVSAHSIKTLASFAFAPEKRTKHKTTRAPRHKHEQTSRWMDKPPPAQRLAFGRLLNEYLMTVDLTSYRKSGCFFLYLGYHLCRLSVWECYIAKYP